jgi:hypothetical protein
MSRRHLASERQILELFEGLSEDGQARILLELLRRRSAALGGPDGSVELLLQDRLELLDQLADAAQDKIQALTKWKQAVSERLELAAVVRAEFDRRRRPTANAERDHAIVRLRTQDNLSWSRLGRRLMQENPAWAQDDGKPLPVATLKTAFRRAVEKAKGGT